MLGSDEPERAQEPARAPVPASRPVPVAPTPAPAVKRSEDPDVQRVQRRADQRDVLSRQFIAQGDSQVENAEFENALVSYASALEVDPGNQTARERMLKVEALMGRTYAVAADALADEVEREIVRRAQARISADRAATLGDNALRGGRYTEAIAQYREAELILHYHPLIADGSLDESIIRGKLASAISLGAEADADARRHAEQAAEDASNAEAMAEATRRENKLSTLFAAANAAFLNEHYQTAEALCTQLLLDDPRNEDALGLRDVAREARHASVEARNRRDHREQWLRTFEELDTMSVPQNEPLIFDDLRRWREVVQREPLEQVSSSDALDASDKAAVIARLEQTRFAPNFEGEDGDGAELVQVAAFLQDVTGVNFVISTRVVEDLDDDETMIRLTLPERSVLGILKIIAETRENLRWKIEDGVVKFVTREELVGGQVLRMYEVRDLIRPIPEFPGRDINVSVTGGLFLPEEDLEEREANVVTSDLLDTLIRNNIAPESWDDDPANSLRINEMGVMIVNQTPEVHAQIRELLTDLREATGILVDIETRFLQVADNFLEDIGVDFRGLGQPGLGTDNFFDDFGATHTQREPGPWIGQGTDFGAFLEQYSGDVRMRIENLYEDALYDSLFDQNALRPSGGLSFQWTYLNDLQLQLVLRAVEKSERTEIVSSPRILVSNTGRANLTFLNQVAYVKDFDVEIAQAASIADPIIDVVEEGVILDVRPVVSADRRFITIELRPTIAVLTRPIEERVTTLGSQNSVTIQLPELNLRKVRTSIVMPDGATVLLGGLKNSEKRSVRSGVPILNKIPFISALFERKGNSISNRKLMILLKATIIIPAEHEPTPAQLGF
jgi:type II secretory pathway component GspD/PulD (secretin)/tetratricopeptide (TPR) repeat protein